MNSTQPSKTSSVDSDLMSTAVAPVTVGASASASGMIEIGSSSVAPAPVLVSAPSAPASATAVAVGSELMSTATASSTKGASSSSAMVELGSSSPSAAPAPSSATTTIAKPRRKYHKSNQGQSPLFAFHETPHDLSSASSIGRPKRKLKAITRFDECQYYNSISNSKRNSTKIKTGEGFQCPRCSSFCSYDVRGCDCCGLECYYEAGVGVVTLKERRVSVNGVDVNSPKKKRRRSRKNNQIKEGTTSSQTDVIDLSQSRSQTEARPWDAADAECAPQNIPTNHNQSSQSQSSPRSVASAMSARLGQEDVNLGSSSPRESETTVDDSSIPKTTAYTLIDDVDATIIKRDQSKETCDMIAADTVSQMLSIPTEAPKRMMLAVPKDASIASISKTKSVSPRKNAQENSSEPQLKSMIRTVTADGDDTHHKLSISSSADPTLRGLDCESNNKTSVNNNNNKPAGKDDAAVTAGDEKPLAVRFTKKRGPGRPPKSGTPAHESKSAHNNNNKISKANNTSSKVALGSAIPNNNNINNNNNHNNNNNNNNDNDNDKSTKGNKNNNNNNNPAMTKQLIEQREQIKLATRSNLELTLQVSRLQADNDGMKTTLKVCKQKQKASLLDSTTSAEDECKIVPMEVKAAARGETTLRGSSEEMVEKNECLSLQSLHYWNKSSEGPASKSGSSSPSNLSPPLNLEQQLAELQAKYDTHLSRTTLSECSYKATISNLEVSLKKKDEEMACISATMFSLRGRITTQKEDLDKGQEELFKLRQVLADDSLNTGNIESLYNPTLDNDADDPSSLPHPLSPMHTMPTDVSNCSSQMEELQSKMEDVVAERDAADKQVKELLCVQLQKDELLVKLQDAETMLAHSEKGRKEDKERYENQERAVCDNASEKRERICELEGMLEVVTGQRDRASARVRKLLLSDKNSSIDDYILEGGEVINNKSSAQKVLDSFQLENNQLATSLKETKAEVLLLRSDEATAVKTCATLEDTVKELQTRIEQIEYQNSKLQQQQHTNRFHESSFRSGHDDCLRELENINTTNDLTAADESASLNDGSLVSSLNGNGEGTGTHARILGLPTSVASLNVPPSPLLAGAAETERQEEISELDGLTDALGSLGPMNEFEDFLLGLGLDDEQS